MSYAHEMWIIWYLKFDSVMFHFLKLTLWFTTHLLDNLLLGCATLVCWGNHLSLPFLALGPTPHKARKGIRIIIQIAKEHKSDNKEERNVHEKDTYAVWLDIPLPSTPPPGPKGVTSNSRKPQAKEKMASRMGIIMMKIMPRIKSAIVSSIPWS